MLNTVSFLVLNDNFNICIHNTICIKNYLYKNILLVNIKNYLTNKFYCYNNDCKSEKL